MSAKCPLICSAVELWYKMMLEIRNLSDLTENHIKRKAFNCKLTKEQAQSKLSKNLKVINSKRCVIPKESGNEVNCYEFRCKSNDTKEEVLIYINADKGYEENIMLLLYSDGGTLTK